MNDWTHAIEGLAGAAISCLMFVWYISARLTRIETLLELLMDGRELVKIRQQK